GFAFTPAQTLYVGTDLGVFVSFDAGTQWTAFSSGLPTTPVTDITLRQPEALMWASTFGRAAYQASVAGLAASVIVSPMSLNVSVLQGGSATLAVTLVNATIVRRDYQLAPVDSWLIPDQASGQLESRGSARVAFRVSAATLQPGVYIGRLRVTSGT